MPANGFWKNIPSFFQPGIRGDNPFFEFQYYAIFFINVKNDTSRHVFGIIFGINKYKFQVVLTFLLEGHGFEVFYTL